MPKPTNPLVQAESMFQMAMAVPAGCFAGLLVGYFLDKYFHTYWIVIAGLILGVTGGFIQIFATAARLNRTHAEERGKGIDAE